MLFRGAKHRIFSYFFLVKKVSKKTFVAVKASAFISERSLQKQNSSYLLKHLFLLRYLIPIKARFTFTMRRISLRVIMFLEYFDDDERQTERSRSPLFNNCLI